ncbi:SRPBCC family protein [Actinoplanes subglobosus]|uniref:SRPBCC family protein n=1 Tax=Actinoplanes subglobosus TaxID=1547892 RepID=A0ABV8JBA4_9ACTN
MPVTVTTHIGATPEVVWDLVADVTRIGAADRGREFGFDVVGAGFLAVARWTYTLRPDGDGCEVTETYTDRRGPALKLFGIAMLRIPDRDAHNRRTMTETLNRLRLAAEAPTEAA